ncbi:hypothetical protein LY78DRAFT_733612 [Colletotrichum sublineola]|nr:hypothetical protein LY78DRAFT_733612 [Colletotrichum sublineola]
MRLFSLIWLLYAQLAVAAGPSHAAELLHFWVVYNIDHLLNPNNARLLLPAVTELGKIPKNVGTDNGGKLPFRSFVSRCLNDNKKVPADLTFDINNPLRETEKLRNAGFGETPRMMVLKGVPENMWKNHEALAELDDRWKKYHVLLQDIRTTVQDARKKLGDSAIAKELTALRTLNQEIVRLRNEDMMPKKYFANELKETWFERQGNVFYQPVLDPDGKIKLDKRGNLISELRLDFMMADVTNGNKIRELLGMSDQHPSDPRWKAAFKTWCSYLGDVDGLIKNNVAGPRKFTEASNKHKDVEKNWSTLLEDLRCER